MSPAAGRAATLCPPAPGRGGMGAALQSRQFSLTQSLRETLSAWRPREAGGPELRPAPVTSVPRECKRTQGVSTTDLVGRMLLMTKAHHSGQVRRGGVGVGPPRSLTSHLAFGRRSRLRS